MREGRRAKGRAVSGLVARCLKTCGPGKWDSIQTRDRGHAAAQKGLPGKRPVQQVADGCKPGARGGAAELAQMRKAALLAAKVVESAIGLLKPGVREFEIAAEIEYQMRKGDAPERPSKASWRSARALRFLIPAHR